MRLPIAIICGSLLCLAGSAAFAGEAWQPGEEPDAPASAKVPVLNGNSRATETAPEEADNAAGESAPGPRAKDDVANYRFWDGKRGGGGKPGTGASRGPNAGKMSIMVSNENFAGLLGYEYSFNSFMAWDLAGSYRSRTGSDSKQSEYGPMTYLRLRLANPLMLVPFYDYGVAYYTWSWNRPASPSVTLGRAVESRHAGINLHFARHFTLVLQQTWSRFFTGAPTIDETVDQKLLASKRLEVLFEFSF